MTRTDEVVEVVDCKMTRVNSQYKFNLLSDETPAHSDGRRNVGNHLLIIVVKEEVYLN